MANGLWYANSKADEIEALMDAAVDGDPYVPGILLALVADAYDEGMRVGYRSGKAHEGKRG